MPFVLQIILASSLGNTSLNIFSISSLFLIAYSFSMLYTFQTGRLVNFFRSSRSLVSDIFAKLKLLLIVSSFRFIDLSFSRDALELVRND